MNDPRPNPSAAETPNPTGQQALRHLRAEIRAMHGYTPGEQVPDCIKLNTNECAVDPSPHVRAAIAGIVDERLRRYPDPLARRLREVAAGVYDTTPDRILAGNGSDDCLTILYRGVLRPGDRVCAPFPTYGLYDTLAALQSAEMVHVDYRQDAAQWHLPAALPRQGAKLVLVANPNNPSATLTPVIELRRLCDAVDGLVAIDEAYIDFALAADPATSILPFLDAHPNLVVLRTFSKSYSLAGARLGLLFAAPALVAELMKVKDSYNVNVLSQAAGIAALEDRDHFRGAMRSILAERTRLEALLRGFGWSWPVSAANFLLCQVGPRAGEIYRALKARGLLVRFFDTPALREKLRITVGRPEHTDALIAALRELA